MLYLLGGVSSPHAVDDITAVEVLDTWSLCPAWCSVPDLPHKRRGGGFTAFRSAVLAVAGFNTEARDRLRTVDAYATGPGAWRRLSLPAMLAGRSAGGVVVAQDMLVVVGGLVGQSGEPTGTCERCDLGAAEPRWEPLPDLPRPRVAPQCVAVVDEVLVVGGGVPDVGFTGSIEACRLSDAAAGWTERSYSLEVPRHAFGCCVATKRGRTYLVACGGHNYSGALATCESIALDGQPPDLSLPDLPEPRMGCSATVVTAAAVHVGLHQPREWLVVVGGSRQEREGAAQGVLALDLVGGGDWREDVFPPLRHGRCFATAVVGYGYPS